MKQFTDKFLNRTCVDEGFDATEHNGEQAKKLIGFPIELWLQLSTAFSLSELRQSFKNKDITSAFFAGVAVGWAEKNNKVK